MRDEYVKGNHVIDFVNMRNCDAEGHPLVETKALLVTLRAYHNTINRHGVDHPR